MGEGTERLKGNAIITWQREMEKITIPVIEKLRKMWGINMQELWMFQITIEDELRLRVYPNFQIEVATKEEMRNKIKNFYRGGFHIKVNKCKKMTNADWLYLKEYKKWWNDQNLITPDYLKHH